jgi:hypothetical protein
LTYWLSDQERLISFKVDEDDCRAISAAGNDEQDRIRAERPSRSWG